MRRSTHVPRPSVRANSENATAVILWLSIISIVQSVLIILVISQ